MRHQHVGVDVVKMIVSSCSYLALAFAAWVLLRLVQACFYLPGILRRRNEEEAQQWLRTQQLPSSSDEASTSKDSDKIKDSEEVKESEEVKDSDEIKDSNKRKDSDKRKDSNKRKGSDKRKDSDKRKNGDKRRDNDKRKAEEAEKLLQAEKSDVDDSPDEGAAAAQPSTSAADGDKETKKDI